MVQEKTRDRLQMLNMTGEPSNDFRSVLDRHDILLGKLTHEVGSGNVLYGIEDPTTSDDITTHAAISGAHHTQSHGESDHSGDIIPDANQTFTGDLIMTGNIILSGNIFAQSGSAAAPSISFLASSTTGLFRQASNVIGFALGGSEKWRMTGSLFRANSGSESIQVDTIDERIGGSGVTIDTAQIKDNGIVFIEAADHPITPTATKGQIWVKTASPNELWFTDDGGTDTQLGVGGGGGQDLATDTLWAAAGDLVKGTGNNTADILSIGADHTILVSNGAVPSWSAAPPLANIADTGDTNRITLSTSLPTVTAIGTFKVDGFMAVDIDPDSGLGKIYISESAATISASWRGLHVNPVLSQTANSKTHFGVSGQTIVKLDGGTVGNTIFGLEFIAQANAADLVNGETATASTVVGAKLIPYVLNNQLSAPSGDRTIDVTTIRGAWVAPLILYLGARATGSVATFIGVDIEDPASDHVVDYTAIQIDAETAATGTIIGIRQNGVAMENRFESNLNTFGRDAAATATIHAIQDSTSGAKPVLRLQQDDIDDSFIDFVGTSAADGSRSISSDTTEDAAKFGAYRVEVNGATKWVRVYDDES